MGERGEGSIDPNLKDDINKEGWEDNAALIIGKKEGGEVDKLMEKLENGGICADAATYVKLNKRISVPVPRVPDNIAAQVGKGWIGNEVFVFIDSSGNIADVNIDYKKISSIPQNIKESWPANSQRFAKELQEYGFDIKPGFESHDYLEVGRIRGKQKEAMEESMRIRKKNEFDF